MTADLLLLSALAFGWWYAKRPRGRDAYHQYLKSVGWKLTKFIRKESECHNCKSRHSLELHHESYTYHNRYTWIFYIVPNMFDSMKTLCRVCHERTHRK